MKRPKVTRRPGGRRLPLKFSKTDGRIGLPKVTSKATLMLAWIIFLFRPFYRFSFVSTLPISCLSFPNLPGWIEISNLFA